MIGEKFTQDSAIGASRKTDLMSGVLDPEFNLERPVECPRTGTICLDQRIIDVEENESRHEVGRRLGSERKASSQFFEPAHFVAANVSLLIFLVWSGV
jgi:hypothetical protein